MTRKFKVGDKVTVTGVPGQPASWLYDGMRGIVQALYEDRMYPNEVRFPHVGTLCFADNELTHAAEENPGRRLLDETSGFHHGIDAAAAQKVMRGVFTGDEQAPNIDIERVIEHLENVKQCIETEIKCLREVV